MLWGEGCQYQDRTGYYCHLRGQPSRAKIRPLHFEELNLEERREGLSVKFPRADVGQDSVSGAARLVLLVSKLVLELLVFVPGKGFSPPSQTAAATRKESESGFRTLAAPRRPGPWGKMKF